MTIVRRFLIPSSLARLVAREKGSTPITEGYFAGQQGRVSYVSLDGERAQLVLISEPTGSAPVEERTEIPRAHADALLDVCAGRLTLERSSLSIEGGADVHIERITHPGVLTSVTVEFDNPDEATAFTPPAWFGPEVTSEPSFGRQAIALDRLPDVGEVPVSNSTVEAVLDLLEGRRSAPPVASPAQRPSVEASILDALRSLSTGLAGRSTAPAEAETSPAPQMLDIDGTATHAPEAEQKFAPAERERAHSVDAHEASRPSTVRPRLFPRLTH